MKTERPECESGMQLQIRARCRFAGREAGAAWGAVALAGSGASEAQEPVSPSLRGAMKISRLLRIFGRKEPCEIGPAVARFDREVLAWDAEIEMEKYRERAAQNYVHALELRIKAAFAESLRMARDTEEIQRGVDKIFEDARAEKDAQEYVRRELFG